MDQSGVKWFKSGVILGMFMGEYQHTIDEKGRLIIPAKFRDELGEKFVITKGLDGCLFVYPLAEWTILENKLRSLPFTKADARAFARFFFSGAIECELDKQCRALISSTLRDYSKLDKEVVIIGVGSRIEIWSKEVWVNYSSEAEENYEEIAEKMVDFDINF